MGIPTLAEITALHKKYAPSQKVFDVVFTHCQIVRDIAEQLITKNNLQVDAKFVQAACLLHDIGVYHVVGASDTATESKQYITHGIKGEAILKSEGFPEALWRVASHHTGVGITEQQVVDYKLPLPIADYTAATAEERLVMYADKFHSKTKPASSFNSFEWYKAYVAKFGEDKATKFEALAAEFGMPNLVPLAEKYGQTIRT